MILNAIIVEDEPLSRAFLNGLLTSYCPDVKMLSAIATESDAIESITRLNPDLIFLDIELQTSTGFDILKNLANTDFQVIFTTAHNDDTIKIIKISGVQYLQKPIDIEDLKEAIKIVSEKINTKKSQAALTNLIETLRNDNIPVKLMVQTIDEIESLIIKDIIRIEGDGSNCSFVLKLGMKKTALRNLHEYGTLLSSYNFFRTHNQHIVNLNEITTINNTEEATVIMSDGSIVPLSPKRKDELISIMQRNSGHKQV